MSELEDEEQASGEEGGLRWPGLVENGGLSAERRQAIIEGAKWKVDAMKSFANITLDPQVMGGKPCIRGLRVTVGTVVGLLAAGQAVPEILEAYPYLKESDIREALSYAAWRVEEAELPLNPT